MKISVKKFSLDTDHHRFPMIADILVDNKVIVELKAVSDLSKVHEVQLVNYLKATGIKVGLLINFGEKIKIVRKVF